LTLAWLRARWRYASIRMRLAIIMAAALAPILIANVGQATLAYQQQRTFQSRAIADAAALLAERVNVLAAEARTGLAAQARGTIDECSLRPESPSTGSQAFFLVISVSPAGRICSASATKNASLVDPRDVADKAKNPASGHPAAWTGYDALGRGYIAISAGASSTTAGAPVRIGLIWATNLLSQVTRRAAANETQITLLDGGGRVLAGDTPSGAPRLSARATAAGAAASVLVSTPAHSAVEWAWMQPMSAIGLPVIAFFIALGGVWVVADTAAVRWIGYLERVAAIYARGRYGVRPERARRGPPEIRNLALTMEHMAKTIASRDQALRLAVTQKDALLREIHHRVKNNLQVISSLLSLRQRALLDPAAKEALGETRKRVSALALIYQSLYEGPDLKCVDLKEFLEELVRQQSRQDPAGGAGFSVKVSADSIEIDPDRLATFALYAVEVLSLAQTGATAASALQVSLHRMGADLQFTIAVDHGDEHSSDRSLDLEGSLARSLATQLGGTVAVDKRPTIIRLTFPMNRSGDRG